MLSGAEMIVRFLEDEGVEYLYGYPGGAVLHIYDAIHRQNKVKHILVRHEQAAAHMADGYARATGKTGVLLVTSGPGATNIVTGVATAYMDSVPMVALCGQVASHLIGEDAFQETDILGVTRPIVKHSFSIRKVEDIPVILKKAFYIANSGRPGPVLVEIPKDMTAPQLLYPYHYPKKIKLRGYNPRYRGHSGQIKKALELIYQAKRPVMIAGGGVVSNDASTVFAQLARRWHMPVVTTLMGIGAYPQTDAQYLGFPGMHGSFTANQAMHHADVLFCIGMRFDDRVTNNISKFCPDARIIHVDVDPSSISKTVMADIPIVGAAQAVLSDFLQEDEQLHSTPLEANRLAHWWTQIAQWREQQQQYRDEEPEAEHLPLPAQVIRTLYELTQGRAYIVTDVGQHQMFAAQHYLFDQPRRWITSGGLGTMGFGLPAAMGIKLNLPNEQVILITGEGSFQMMMQELGTCQQYQIPIKVIQFDNYTLGMVHQWQRLLYESRYAESQMSVLPDFVQLMKAYGFSAHSIDQSGNLRQSLQNFLSDPNEFGFLEVKINPQVLVYPMQIAGGAMNEMMLSETERT